VNGGLFGAADAGKQCAPAALDGLMDVSGRPLNFTVKGTDGQEAT
jgi:hypothetical protein